MNNPASMVIESKVGKVKGPESRLPPDEQAKIRTYENKDGSLYVPSEWLALSMQYAGKGRKIGKVSAAVIVPTAVFTRVPSFNLIDSKGNPIKTYELFTKSVWVGNGRIMRGRPMLRDWRCVVEFDYDPVSINEDIIDTLLTRAGEICGWGDYSPRTGKHKPTAGPYGTFMMEQYNG
jgi:hypothetical protein